MIVNEPVAPMRGLRDPFQIVHIVAGKQDSRYQIRQGEIKSVKFASNVMSPLLQVQWRNNVDGRRDGVIAVDILPSLRAKGWVLLRELYEAEGRLDDYAEYLKWYEFVSTGRTQLQFPEDMLPDKLHEMRKAKGFENEWVPPVRKTGNKSSVKPSAA